MTNQPTPPGGPPDDTPPMGLPATPATPATPADPADPAGTDSAGAATPPGLGGGEWGPQSPPAAPLRRPRCRWPRWLPRSWPDLRSRMRSWWASAPAAELRAAWHDSRRALGWILLGCIAVFWPLAGFSLWPVILGGGLWLAGTAAVARMRRRARRRRVRRWLRRAAAVIAFGLLAVEAGPFAWGLAAGLWLMGAGLTETLRARQRLLRWLIAGVASIARIDPAELEVTHVAWQGRRLQGARLAFTKALRADEQGVRDKVAAAVAWRLRHVGAYQVSWPPGVAAVDIGSLPPLPPSVYDLMWPDNLPAIPLGVTDRDAAHLIYEERDQDTNQTLLSLPLAAWNPHHQRNIGVIGGTGAGKTNFVRGFIRRGLKHGWFPGGVIIIDGKGSSSYAPFLGRQGVLRIAREPEEWAAALQLASQMMRSRYDAQWAYEIGHGPKPDLPRYLVVVEECQEVRAVLGKDADRFYDQLGRQIRESGGTLMLVTQRPDTEGAIPGPVRDQLEDWVILGFVSATGARMVLDKDWKAVVDEYGEETVPGRGMARVGGRLLRIQAFLLDSPRQVPAVEFLYPPRVDQADQAQPQQPLPANVAVWAPRTPAADAAIRPDGADVDPDVDTPPLGVPKIGLAAGAEDQQPPADRPRPPRRRTRRHTV